MEEHMRLTKILIISTMILLMTLTSCINNNYSSETTSTSSAESIEESSDTIAEEIIFWKDQTYIGASNLNEFNSKISDRSQSVFLEMAMEHNPNYASVADLDNLKSTIFNNPLLHLEKYDLYRVYHKNTEFYNGKKSAVFTVSWHPKECDEKYHTVCEVLQMELVGTNGSFINSITQGLTLTYTDNGIKYFYRSNPSDYYGHSTTTYVYVIHEALYVRIYADNGEAVEFKDIYNLLCYGKELSEIFEPFFVEE